MDPQRLIPGDPTLIENIVNFLKAKGIFDEFRHECLADVDTKSSCQNLSQRVDGYTSKFLANETWHPDMNKNELRNKLRRNIDESGMLAVGADHVVEQVINPKIHQVFLPKIIEVVHQFIKEQNELLNKKPGPSSSDNTSSVEKTVHDNPESKVKTSVSDPIADILSFTYSKSKPVATTTSSSKNDNTQQKHVDFPKAEKKKEEKPLSVTDKGTQEIPPENITTSTATEGKTQIDKEKEKFKKEEHEVSQVIKKTTKEELKPEKKKTEEVKAQNADTILMSEENKANISTGKPSGSSKKDTDKPKIKSNSAQKSSSSSSEIKKFKKESSDKSLEKSSKSKPTKSPKESTSPVKNIKEEKIGESSKTKSLDSSSSKSSDSSVKKFSKSNIVKKDSSKPKSHGDKSKASKSSDKDETNIHSDSTSDKNDKSKPSKSFDKNDQSTHSDSYEKTDKSKMPKSTDKSEQNVHYDSSNSEKVCKSAQYSSSYDSSQGSDQEKSSSSSSKKERQKHFYKHAKKEKSKEHSDKQSKFSCDKKMSDSNERSGKLKNEKASKLEKLKEATVGEAAKINSRSNSFGSTSSVSSSSNTSKDNLVSTNSDEISENSLKDKKKKQAKERDSCQNPTNELPPPPPPPPSSSSLLCDLPSSSAEMSSVEDTQSSITSESSSSESESEASSSDSELESNDLVSDTLNENFLNSPSDDINNFYDIFLYSSSSSEFEGFEKSPEKKKSDALDNAHDSDVSVSSVHTSDLSSYNDEISDDDFSLNEFQEGGRRKLTLKEAQELIKNYNLPEKSKNNSTEDNPNSNTVLSNDRSAQKSSSSDEESSPSETKRSLRRERKLNPRYASSEYTSIFNSRKETFITKQSSPVKSSSCNSSPSTESKCAKKEISLDKNKMLKKTSLEAKINAVYKEEMEQLHKIKNNVHNLKSSAEKVTKEFNEVSGISSADEMDSIMNKELYKTKEKLKDNSENNHLKTRLKLRSQNNSQLNVNSHSLKRKIPATESTPNKRPCSRSSVDSSSSEFAPNENKPFNSETQNIVEDKVFRDGGLKTSDLIKKDSFYKQRTNNNGDVLMQKDIFPKNSHGKTISTAEKMSESDASKELNVL